MALQESIAHVVRQAIAAQKETPGALLPILHDIQDELGYIPPDAVTLIAGELNLSRAEVHGVISFYHYFRQHPPGKHVVQICQAESCQAMGSEALTDYAKNLLKAGFHETSTDGEFTLEPVYCLGNCACSPALMIDDDIHGRVSPAQLEQLLADARKAQS